MMKYNLVWDEEFEPEATAEQLNQIEQTLNITIPSELRMVWTTFGLRCPQRNGVTANHVIGPDPQSGQNVLRGIFSGFIVPEYLHADSIHPTIDGLDDNITDFEIPKVVVPFADNGGSPIFLNYDNDPTRANPEIWDSYPEGDSLDEAWSLVAPNIDTYFSRLKTEQEAIDMGVSFPESSVGL